MLRRLPCAVLVAGIAWLSTATTLSAAPREDSNVSAAAETASPSNEPFAIFGDETYRRDGALTKFRTCLAIADDPRVQNVWQHPDFAEARDARPYDLVGTLRNLPNSVRLQRGFGTVFACAHIVAAWYAKTIGNDPREPFYERQIGRQPVDGRFEHGATVIDLQLNRHLRALIEPVAMLRILTSPGLLPKASFGGIVLRNAIVNGPLVMHNLHLTSPLAFVNVKFAGRSFAKDLFDNPRKTEDTAIAIAFSEFENHVFIANSEICGKVMIQESHFRETLAFDRVRQRTIGCQPIPSVQERRLMDATDPRLKRFAMSAWISASQFDQSLSFIGTNLDFLRLIGNRIDSLLVSTSGFGRELRVWENDLGSLQINCSILAAKADISYNQVEKDLFIYGTRVGGEYGSEGENCRSWWAMNQRMPENHRSDLKMTSNRIGGGLGLEDLDGALINPPMDLSSNRVGNGSLIELPSDKAKGRPWHGVVNLEGSTYEGKIELTHAPSSAAARTGRNDGDYCDIHTDNPPTVATIDFTAARIRTLEWHLPFTCDYRWRGYGLTYDLWLAGDTARDSAGFQKRTDDQNVLPFWRLMLDVFEPAALTEMSRYLAENGSSVSSRSVLLEAKRLNYAPACPPDWYAIGCPISMDWPSVRNMPRGVSGIAARAQASETAVLDGVEGSWLPPVFADMASVVWSSGKYVLSVLMLFFLWPGGYGAAPEQALVLIVVLAVIFWRIYRRYSESLKSDLDLVPNYSDEVAWLETSPLADLPERPEKGRELKDGPPPRFVHDKAPLKQSVADGDEETSEKAELFPWPTKGEWQALNMEERLHVMQDILLPATRKRAEESEQISHQQDLKALRLKLEHFGNTETLGFSLFDRNKMPTRFTHWLYSIDTVLPFIDLHAYGNYYPESAWIRACSVVQHVLGWWLITVFIASAAIL